MCGIAGILKRSDLDVPTGIIRKMTADVNHRGPDDEGVEFLARTSAEGWEACSEANERWTVALGSRRLSILDLSSAGHMPMTYQNRFWIVYNGEVYNFVEMRVELERLGHSFRSSSDTEVILASYAEWGTGCFERFRGMWAMMIVDGIRNEAILCRDRLGIKPLYLWQGQDVIAVASEIKQFLHVPNFMARINLEVAAEYLQTGYEVPNKSFFRDVHIVPAGSWLRVSLNTLIPSTPEEYWYPEHVQISVVDKEEAGRLVADKLRESIRMHLRSDVPVGCALSGGMDSSSIAMLINELKGTQKYPLHTFTSTFPGDKTDEREYVDAVVKSIRALPHYVTPDPDTFLEDLHCFIRTHDEPVGSLSIYAGYCVARLTREAGISVTQNGQGGDELLSGYWQSYFLHLRELGKSGHIASLMGHFIGALTENGNPTLLNQVFPMLRRYYARSKPIPLVRLHKELLTAREPVLKSILALDAEAWRVQEIRNMFLPRLLKWDDRNSMAFSVEGRYPFLDHELIELCLSFAPQVLYHRGWTKWPLRIGLRDVLPDQLLSRRTKFGFEVPQDTWLCGPLRPELEKWLRQDRPLWDYVERSGVRRLANQTWQFKRKWGEPGQALFRLFVFDRWAEIFGVVR